MKKYWIASGKAVLAPLLLSAFTLAAHAEDASKAVPAKPAAAATKPAASVQPVKPTKPDATAKPADTGDTAKAAKAKKPKAKRAKSNKDKPHKSRKHKVRSVCWHLDQTTCGANKACDWIEPKHHKKHKLAKPYCRLVAGVALKHSAKAAAQSKAPTPAKAN